MTDGARAFEASDGRALTITPVADEAIRAHGQQTYPHECCGALLGRDGHATDLVALPNTTEEGPRRRFLVRPGDYRQAEQRATALGVDLLGFYHSHPDSPARPSEFDREHAWPWYTYLIISIEAGHAGPLNAWQLRDDRSGYEAVPLSGSAASVSR